MAVYDLIDNDPGVCPNCFARWHEIESGRRWFGSLGWMTVSYRYAPLETTELLPADDLTRGMVRICDCGYGSALNRPLPKSTFYEYAENLEGRLAEIEDAYADLDFDHDRFWDELRSRKTDPDEQFADDAIYAAAVEAAAHTNTDRGPQL